MALKLRDINYPIKLEHQLLIVPCLQAFDFNTPSYHLQSSNAFLPKDWMIHYWLLYGLGNAGNSQAVGFAYTNDHTSSDAKSSKYAQFVRHDILAQKYIPQSFLPDGVDHGNAALWNQIKDVILNPYFAPLMSNDVSKLPSAYIITADYDVLRDDGLMYARKLSDAGNKVVIRNYAKAFHAIIDHFNTIEVSKQAFDELVAYFGQHL